MELDPRNMIDEEIHEILEGYFRWMGLTEEERVYERMRCGLALLAYSAELAQNIEEERFHYLREVTE